MKYFLLKISTIKIFVLLYPKTNFKITFTDYTIEQQSQWNRTDEINVFAILFVHLQVVTLFSTEDVPICLIVRIDSHIHRKSVFVECELKQKQLQWSKIMWAMPCRVKEAYCIHDSCGHWLAHTANNQIAHRLLVCFYTTFAIRF